MWSGLNLCRLINTNMHNAWYIPVQIDYTNDDDDMLEIAVNLLDCKELVEPNILPLQQEIVKPRMMKPFLFNEYVNHFHKSARVSI